MAKPKLKFICQLKDLTDVKYRVVDILLKRHSTTAIVFMFNNAPYAYVNHCMHMQRSLNCQKDDIFDDTGKLLRCSMHGFVFEPTTGECLSPVCLGQKLQVLNLKEIDGELFFTDKHLRLG